MKYDFLNHLVIRYSRLGFTLVFRTGFYAGIQDLVLTGWSRSDFTRVSQNLHLNQKRGLPRHGLQILSGLTHYASNRYHFLLYALFTQRILFNAQRRHLFDVYRFYIYHKNTVTTSNRCRCCALDKIRRVKVALTKRWYLFWFDVSKIMQNYINI